MKHGTQLRRVGRSTRAKNHAKWKRELSKYWQQNPIEYCEVRLPGCYGTYGLSPAHSRKRFDIHTREQYFEVVAACQKCHERLDQEMSHEQMEIAVKEIIERRII